MTSKENIILQYLKSIYIKISNKIGFMIPFLIEIFKKNQNYSHDKKQYITTTTFNILNEICSSYFTKSILLIATTTC